MSFQIPLIDSGNIGSGKLRAADKNDRYVLKHCLVYLHRHLKRFPSYSLEACRMIVWIMGQDTAWMARILMEHFDREQRQEIKSQLMESDHDVEDYAQIFSKMLQQLGTRCRKKIIKQILDKLSQKQKALSFRGKADFEKNILAIKKSKDTRPVSNTEFRNTVEMALEAHDTLLHRGEKPVNKDRIEKNYSLEGLNLKGDLKAMIRQLESFDRHLRTTDVDNAMNMNLLFYGPPGTGKSELARYIGSRLDREIICKRISDLKSMWVGEGEKNIKRAFEEAESEDAILIIDEADSLLFNREQAVRSWEVSFTNEFLTQMERFRGILICTTNRVKDLDAASLRRLNHKIGFDYLTPDGSAIFYRLFLEYLTREVMAKTQTNRLKRLVNLAPGDFRVVRDRFTFYPPNEISHEVMITALEAEANLKTIHNNKKTIGF